MVLMPYSGGQPLHVSELELPDQPGSKEVCANKRRTDNLESILSEKRRREIGRKSRTHSFSSSAAVL